MPTSMYIIDRSESGKNKNKKTRSVSYLQIVPVMSVAPWLERRALPFSLWPWLHGHCTHSYTQNRDNYYRLPKRQILIFTHRLLDVTNNGSNLDTQLLN